MSYDITKLHLGLDCIIVVRANICANFDRAVMQQPAIASNRIRLLPEHISNHIAAGEVVQRPSNIVKELVENSIDAKATSIRVRLQNGGKALVEVSDNGIGMNPYDARMSFERHATSKIRTLDDVSCISTMGFRGEALPSITAIAQVEMKTRTKDDNEGIYIKIDQSKLVVQEPCAIKVGTTINVKNLFFHVPARKHFLKSDYTELKHIINEFTRIAMCYPQISFELSNNKETLFQLSSSSLKVRILQLLGKTYEQALIPISSEDEHIRIGGFIGKPSLARKSKTDTFLIVNKRYVRSPFLHKAIINGYGALLPEFSIPFYVITLEIDPKQIDINIHPSKQEIKFADEKWIFTLLQSQIKYCIAKYNIDHPIQFDIDAQTTQISPTSNNKVLPQTKATNALLNAFATKNKGTYIERNWDQEIADIIPSKLEIEEKGTPNAAEEKLLLDSSIKTIYTQILRSFILVEQENASYIIDQQRAHERILYELFLDKKGSASPYPQEHAQTLTDPLAIHLNLAHTKIVSEYQAILKQYGYHIETIGMHDIAIYAIPKEISEEQAEDAIKRIIEEETTQHNETTTSQERTARIWAKSHAIRTDKILPQEQLRYIAQSLFALPNPSFSIDGHPIYKKISAAEIRKSWL